MVRAFVEASIEPVVFDGLSRGHDNFVPEGVSFARGTLLTSDLVRRSLAEHNVEGVIRAAGFESPGESVKRRLHTYEQNVVASAVLLRAMIEVGRRNIVFSFSCSTYGSPDVERVVETRARVRNLPSAVRS